ncbi:hypothetical protein T05_6605 [Trichinella murrelli]|uniref:Uncharacterized protein n=1 Tax=Trichinella murrelli TaxID=144512 RepID=A0A0V0T6Z2_9BILA|nr:hypothetical protein T05_6605 [Trichinella murrelli]
MADISELGLVTNCCGGQEGLKRCSIHQRGYNSCAQADLSHGSITDGSAAGIQNGGFEIAESGRNETHPRHIRRRSLFRRHCDIWLFSGF